MSADLHIHILEGADEEAVKCCLSNTLGSKWFGYSTKHWEHNDEIYKTPDVWIGEVSWLKASLFDDPDRFIPGPVQAVYEVVGEDFREIDDEMIKEIEEALSLENTTSYRLASKESVIKFLKEHYGKKTFTISW